jgi:hypothetical protein
MKADRSTRNGRAGHGAAGRGHTTSALPSDSALDTCVTSALRAPQHAQPCKQQAARCGRVLRGACSRQGAPFRVAASNAKQPGAESKTRCDLTPRRVMRVASAPLSTWRRWRCVQALWTRLATEQRPRLPLAAHRASVAAQWTCQTLLVCRTASPMWRLRMGSLTPPGVAFV